jgi:hypothetical protein
MKITHVLSVLALGGFRWPWRNHLTLSPPRVGWQHNGLDTQRPSSIAGGLIAGGVTIGGGLSASAELYDPSTGTFLPTGDMTEPRVQHKATLLPSGKVSIAGGPSRAD